VPKAGRPRVPDRKAGCRRSRDCRPTTPPLVTAIGMGRRLPGDRGILRENNLDSAKRVLLGFDWKAWDG
jgi:hypothetical protein